MVRRGVHLQQQEDRAEDRAADDLQDGAALHLDEDTDEDQAAQHLELPCDRTHTRKAVISGTRPMPRSMLCTRTYRVACVQDTCVPTTSQ